MPLNILHLLSYSPQPTGSTFFARDIAAEQKKLGHTVFVGCDEAMIEFGCRFLTIPVSKRSLLQRAKNIRLLLAFIREYKIDIIHAHARAASWVGYFAAKFAGIPLVSSVHGRQHIHASTYFNIYGDAILPVSEEIKNHLISDLKFNPAKISILPNGINFTSIEKAARAPARNILFAGRTIGIKGEILNELILNSFEAILKNFPEYTIQIAGGRLNDLSADAAERITSLSRQYGNRISVSGFVNSLVPFYSAAAVVIGAGRVAIEALAAQAPVIALGESEYAGCVNGGNYESARIGNFGDIGKSIRPVIDSNTIIRDIKSAINEPPHGLSARVREDYSAKRIAVKLSDIYTLTRMKKKHPAHIPALMYHKVSTTELETKNKIFITQKKLESQFFQLRARGLTPLTFEQYDQFRNGTIPLSAFPERPVFLTFDDGYEDNYTLLFPLLKKFNFTCTIFALGDRSIRINNWDNDDKAIATPLMTDVQLKEMSSYGIEFGSHTMTHPHLPALSQEQIYAELSESKKTLESLTGKPVISFAYPYGELNDTAKEIAADCGYRYAISTDSGGLRIEDDPFRIWRAYIFPHETFFSFMKKSSPWYRSYYLRKRGS